MPSIDYYKRKAARLEKERDEAFKALKEITTTAEMIAATIANQATLINIEADGRKVRFTFSRAGELTVIETYGTWGQPIEQWRSTLLG